MGHILATVNMKGGVGKTTLTVNLATCLARDYQQRVLVVDLDSQISATLSLLAPQEFARLRRGRRTLSYLIDKVIRPYITRKYETLDMVVESVCSILGLDLLPGDIELYDDYVVSEALHKKAIEATPSKFSEVWDTFEQVLVKTVLDSVRDRYDFILIDCSPGYNLLTRSALVASHYYLLPARPEPLSLVGIQLLQRRIEKLKSKFAAPLPLELLGIVFILSGASGIFSSRYYSQIIERVEQDFRPQELFENRIPMDVNVAKAVDAFTPAVLNAPTSAGSRAFVKLAAEFMQKMQAKSGAGSS